MEAVLGHDAKSCPTPGTYTYPLGTIWQCDCGQRWWLLFLRSGRDWKRVSMKRAKRLLARSD